MRVITVEIIARIMTAAGLRVISMNEAHIIPA